LNQSEFSRIISANIEHVKERLDGIKMELDSMKDEILKQLQMSNLRDRFIEETEERLTDYGDISSLRDDALNPVILGERQKHVHET